MKQLSEAHTKREGRSWNSNQASQAPCFPRKNPGLPSEPWQPLDSRCPGKTDERVWGARVAVMNVLPRSTLHLKGRGGGPAHMGGFVRKPVFNLSESRSFSWAEWYRCRDRGEFTVSVCHKMRSSLFQEQWDELGRCAET